MQGVLVVSSNTAIRKSLVEVLQDGQMVRDCRTLSECLHIAAAEKLDMIFIDDVFEDGTAEELVARLNALGYGFEMVPLLLACDTVHTQPFRSYGVRFFLEKPFKVETVQQLVEQVDEIAHMSQAAMDFARESVVRGGQETAGAITGNSEDAAANVDVREVSQRFRRLLARLQSREDLVRAFADSMQEQFDVDNVVVLLPAMGKPVFEIVAGQIASEIRQQFFIPLDEPLVRSLVRLGEPVWVHECERLGRENAVTAIRYGERLNIQVLCPVLARGRLRALVGLSRFHRYQNSLALVSLLRLFLTFFAEALENAELYESAATAGETYRGMINALPMGALAVSLDGRITHLNPKAAEILAIPLDELVDQPVERAGSMLAHCAHTVIETESDTDWQSVRIGGLQCRVGASRIDGGEDEDCREGVLVMIQEEIAEGEQDEAAAAENIAFDQRLWDDMTSAVAHNFKNSFVPVQTCAELLPKRYQEESFREFFLQTVRENIGRINQWIDQLLSFSRLEEEADWSNVSVNEIIGKVLDEVLGQFPETHLDCSKELSRNDTVRGCPAVLERMFREIFRNAVEAVQDVASPEMTIKSTEDDGQLTIEVLDNGAGFNPETGEDPLRPFSSGKLSGNLGLGLAYAHRAARLHNGGLEFGREGEAGQQTVVRITLPMVKVVTPKKKKAVAPTKN